MKIVCIYNKIDDDIEDRRDVTHFERLLLKKLNKVAGLTLGKTYDGIKRYHNKEVYYMILDDNNKQSIFLASRFELLDSARLRKLIQLGIV